MKIAFIMGVRPEFVQAEPVINNLKKHYVIRAHVEAGLRSFQKISEILTSFADKKRGGQIQR